jgi:hypothetical protein
MGRLTKDQPDFSCSLAMDHGRLACVFPSDLVRPRDAGPPSGRHADVRADGQRQEAQAMLMGCRAGIVDPEAGRFASV